MRTFRLHSELRFLLLAMGVVVSCSGFDEARDKCADLGKAWCARLAECAGISSADQPQYVATCYADTWKSQCNRAAEVGPGFESCIADVRMLACARVLPNSPGLPPSCANAIGFQQSGGRGTATPNDAL